METALYSDFGHLASLRSATAIDSGPNSDSLQEVAQQFSALFLEMALKSMRQANLGEGVFDSQQSEFYQEMLDKQLSLELSGNSSFGLSAVIARQLSPPTSTAENPSQLYSQVAGLEPRPLASDAPQARRSNADTDSERTGAKL